MFGRKRGKTNGKYYFMTTTNEWEAILKMLIPMCTVICLGGSVLLFLCSKGSRSRRLLAGIMLAWGIAYVLRMAGMLLGHMNYMRTDLLAPFLLIGGNLFVIVLLLYPLEVIRPGWLNLKRAFLVTLPYLMIVLIYYIVLWILGESPVCLHHWNDFLLHIKLFNVWYRLVLTFSIIAYVIFLLHVIYRYEIFYQKWCEANYASSEQMEVSWLRYYGIGVILIGIAFLFEVFDGSTYCYVIHNIIVQLFFCFTFYKGFFHESPYMEGHFRHTMNEERAQREAEEQSVTDSGPQTEEWVTDENSFLSKVPAYKAEIQCWMEEKKPYLRKEFKLTDVREILPLNRTYLSQIFNEGWGSSFSNVVRDYRIRYAEELLLNHPELMINHISELCGFTSPSAFHRTFVQCHDGMTPKKFREHTDSAGN